MSYMEGSGQCGQHQNAALVLCRVARQQRNYTTLPHGVSDGPVSVRVHRDHTHLHTPGKSVEDYNGGIAETLITLIRHNTQQTSLAVRNPVCRMSVSMISNC